MENDKTNKTRQIYAIVSEDIYLASKAKATELRLPLRKFIELALEKALNINSNENFNQESDFRKTNKKSIWQDEYLKMQLQQPIGSPIELTEEEANKILFNNDSE
ncbi:MAG: hypothetical protein CL758_06710 [Chloroflexi bacterium]|nr:hypothetical protein [Chloroflexota bacterium]|tara:strand:- start:225 stop:539 length:315 start_codon:yes stop_codon:yes gene_type:complete